MFCPSNEPYYYMQDRVPVRVCTREEGVLFMLIDARDTFPEYVGEPKCP